MEPSVVAADDEPTLGVALMLDPGPAERDDGGKPIVCGRASVVRIHRDKSPICPASAGLFFVVAKCSYRSLRRGGGNAVDRSGLAGAGVTLGVQRPPQQHANCFIAARNFRLRSAPILN
jgi:hypothetical protein